MRHEEPDDLFTPRERARVVASERDGLIRRNDGLRGGRHRQVGTARVAMADEVEAEKARSRRVCVGDVFEGHSARIQVTGARVRRVPGNLGSRAELESGEHVGGEPAVHAVGIDEAVLRALHEESGDVAAG